LGEGYAAAQRVAILRWRPKVAGRAVRAHPGEPIGPRVNLLGVPPMGRWLCSHGT
jgi:hypothetical protein